MGTKAIYLLNGELVIISIKTKMIIIYSLIIILTLVGVSWLVLGNYRDSRIKNEEIRLFKTANIVGDSYKGNMEDLVFAKFMVSNYGSQANARVLIVDSNKKVLIDNYNSYTGKKLDNDEIKSSLKGKAKSGLYQMEDREVLQLSVPITMHTGLENKVVGAVLLSASMDFVNADMVNLKNNILKISALGLFISLLVMLVVTNNMTRPLNKLIQGVEKIIAGDLGYQVEDKREGEIGLLVNSFNHMSHKLNSIESNRKKVINNISHELKTPLTSIRTLIESLSFGEDSKKVYEEYLQDIYKETKRMEDLVGYIMKSIKLEDITLNLADENIGEILRETVGFIQPYADKSKVEVRILEAEDLLVRCDRDKIREVFLNILDNAIKYRDGDKKVRKVEVFLKKLDTRGVLIIEDNGVGIGKDSLAKIFHRDFRVLEGDLPSFREVEGYGIGLSIVQNIIEKHNWTISVDSELGLGSKFIINIPL